MPINRRVRADRGSDVPEGTHSAPAQLAMQAYDPRDKSLLKSASAQPNASLAPMDGAQLVMAPAPWCQPVQPDATRERLIEPLKTCEVPRPAYHNSTQEMVSKLKEMKSLFPTLQNMQDNHIVGTSVTKTSEGNFKVSIKSDKPRQIVFGENEGKLAGADATAPSLGQLKKVEFAAEQSFTVVPDGKGNYQIKDITGIKATVSVNFLGKNKDVESPLPPYTIQADGTVKTTFGAGDGMAEKLKASSSDLIKLVEQVNKSGDHSMSLTRLGDNLKLQQVTAAGKTTEVDFTRTGAGTARVVTQNSEGSMKGVPGHPRCTQIVEPTVSFDLRYHDNGNIDVSNMSGTYVTRHGLLVKGVVGGVDRLSLWHDNRGNEHLTASGWQRGALGRTKPMSRSLDQELYQGRSYR